MSNFEQSAPEAERPDAPKETPDEESRLEEHANSKRKSPTKSKNPTPKKIPKREDTTPDESSQDDEDNAADDDDRSVDSQSAGSLEEFIVDDEDDDSECEEEQSETHPQDPVNESRELLESLTAAEREAVELAERASTQPGGLRRSRRQNKGVRATRYLEESFVRDEYIKLMTEDCGDEIQDALCEPESEDEGEEGPPGSEEDSSFKNEDEDDEEEDDDDESGSDEGEDEK